MAFAGISQEEAVGSSREGFGLDRRIGANKSI